MRQHSLAAYSPRVNPIVGRPNLIPIRFKPKHRLSVGERIVYAANRATMARDVVKREGGTMRDATRRWLMTALPQVEGTLTMPRRKARKVRREAGILLAAGMVC